MRQNFSTDIFINLSYMTSSYTTFQLTITLLKAQWFHFWLFCVVIYAVYSPDFLSLKLNQFWFKTFLVSYHFLRFIHLLTNLLAETYRSNISKMIKFEIEGNVDFSPNKGMIEKNGVDALPISIGQGRCKTQYLWAPNQYF